MRILIADDDRDMVDLLTFWLMGHGYDILQAFDGEQAIARWREGKPDMVLLDLEMPKVDGFEVCQRMSGESNALVLIVTCHDREQDKVHGLELGADDYLTKPFSPAQLLAHIRALASRATSAAITQPLFRPRSRHWPSAILRTHREYVTVQAVPRQDTWGNLPSVTLPMRTIWVDTLGRLSSILSSQLGVPEHELSVDWNAAEAERWAAWGAARAGARTSLTSAQVLALAVLGLAAAVLLYLDAHALLVALIALFTCAYLATGLHKVWLLVRGESAAAHPPAAGALADEDLPLYTVLVPLHREGQMLPVLLERLAAIDYPSDRLEVLLLVEEDDDETHQALGACHLPPHIRPLTAPPGQPRTKPRALNVGLARARGRYLVVYDAEDHPETDQLRKAAAAFGALPRRVICLQARLNFYNRRQTLLTRLFTVDYALWYDALLPGLMRPRAFVPLGGTSNHFRVEALRRLGGWDPFNVTEDCDLGARIARAGLRVAMLDSTTWEEAVTRVGPWVRQRSRWVKGYLQTYLVHMRHPIRLWQQMGPAAFLDFQALVGGAVFALLVNPLMWAVSLAYVAGAYVAGAAGASVAGGAGTGVVVFIQSLFPPMVYYLGLLCLVLGNFSFFYVNLYVCVRHGYDELTSYALLSPLYWVMMSLGAWWGFCSLVRHPHYWAKTVHGASLRLLEPAPSVEGA
jgi:glycosyltransferase XagB